MDHHPADVVKIKKQLGNLVNAIDFKINEHKAIYTKVLGERLKFKGGDAQGSKVSELDQAIRES